MGQLLAQLQSTSAVAKLLKFAAVFGATSWLDLFVSVAAQTRLFSPCPCCTTLLITVQQGRRISASICAPLQAVYRGAVDEGLLTIKATEDNKQIKFYRYTSCTGFSSRNCDPHTQPATQRSPECRLSSRANASSVRSTVYVHLLTTSPRLASPAESRPSA